MVRPDKFKLVMDPMDICNVSLKAALALPSIVADRDTPLPNCEASNEAKAFSPVLNSILSMAKLHCQ